MINHEICVGCPKRTGATLGRLRNACASLALGEEFVAEGCDGGAFPKRRVSESHSLEDVLIGGRLVAVEYGCAKDEEPASIIDEHYFGTEVLIRQGSHVIEHTRNGQPIK